MADLGSIFLGVTSANRSRFLNGVLSKVYEKYPSMVVPCVGTFKIPVLGVLNGYDVKNIYTSDISLFSHLLACYCNDMDLDKVPFVAKGDIREKAGSHGEKAIPYILHLMKTLQLREDVEYEKMYKKELEDRREVYIDKLHEKLKELKTLLNGIEYKAEDLRNSIYDVWGVQKKSLLILDPPMYAKGYSKMFDMKGYLEYEVEVAEFDAKKEYEVLFEKIDKIGKENESPALLFFNQELEDYKDRIVFAEEGGGGKITYIYNLGVDLKLDTHVAVKNGLEIYPTNLKTFSNEDEIKLDSEIKFVKVPNAVAMYYRDLFAHKLGTTQAEINYLMLIDNKVHSVVGFNASIVMKLEDEFIWEMYGFSVDLKKYKTNNRLLMMCISSIPMKKILLADMSSGKNRYYSLKGMKTTCETPYRIHKSNQGVLKLISREKKPNGFYRLVFQQHYVKRGFDDCIREYLEWIKK